MSCWVIWRANSGLPTTYWTAFRFWPARRKSEPWSLAPNSMKPLGPAIASILALAPSASPPAASAWYTSGSKRPTCRAKAVVTSSNRLSVVRRTWSTVKRVSFISSSPRRCSPSRPDNRAPPRTPPSSTAEPASRLQQHFFVIMVSFAKAGRALRPGRAVLPQLHAGTRRPCHQLAGVVGDIALDVAQGAARLDDPGLGGQPPSPHGPQEVDLQLDGGERLALGQGGGV